jgi:hypothetical protein
VLQQGDHEFGPRSRIARDMARKRVDIRNHNRLAPLGSSAAHSFSERNPHAGRLALERPQHQFVTFEEVKTNPIHVGHGVVKQRGGVGGICDGIGLAFEQAGQLRPQLLI